MRKFEDVLDTIDKDKLSTALKPYSDELKKLNLSKFESNIDLGVACGMCVRYLRLVGLQNPENMYHLSDLFELDELISVYNRRTFFKLDVESKINKVVVIHKKKIMLFIDWFKPMINKDDDYFGMMMGGG